MGRARPCVGIPCLFVVLLAGCGQPSDAVDPAAVDPAMQVTTATARLETLRDDLILPGTIVPSVGADWTIYAPEAGLVAEVPKVAGDEVAVGDLLVRFDILTMTQELGAKQALLTLALQRADEARQERDRLESLYEQGLIPRNQLEASRAAVSDAQLAVSRAQGDVELAQVLVDTTRVTARFDGVIHTVWKAPGDFVDGTEHDPVMRVVDPTRTQIALEIPLDRLGRLQAGQVATITGPSGETIIGTASRIERSNDPMAETASVRLAYQSPTPLPLDTEVSVELVLDQRVDAVVVPEEAILRDLNGPYVMVTGEDLIARRRDVRVGLVTGGLAQIASGLDAGERVIMAGASEIADGQLVRVAR